MLAPASSVPQLPLGTSLPMSNRMSLLTCKVRDNPGLLRQEDKQALIEVAYPLAQAVPRGSPPPWISALAHLRMQQTPGS